MADVHTPEIRSMNMSHIRSTETKPEQTVRKYLFSKGLRYRKNVRKLPGCPDIVLPKYRTVIFVNGCFWHHHKNCRYFKWPKSNTEYWRNKITKNEERDKKNIQALEKEGWNVITVWECELKKDLKEETLQKLFNQITS
jgi:DNA mismatch endonuclease (patch repair protein)